MKSIHSNKKWNGVHWLLQLSNSVVTVNSRREIFERMRVFESGKMQGKEGIPTTNNDFANEHKLVVLVGHVFSLFIG